MYIFHVRSGHHQLLFKYNQQKAVTKAVFINFLEIKVSNDIHKNSSFQEKIAQNANFLSQHVWHIRRRVVVINNYTLTQLSTFQYQVQAQQIAIAAYILLTSSDNQSVINDRIGTRFQRTLTREDVHLSKKLCLPSSSRCRTGRSSSGRRPGRRPRRWPVCAASIAGRSAFLERRRARSPPPAQAWARDGTARKIVSRVVEILCAERAPGSTNLKLDS